ncbi:MAG: hypothetical protein EOM87_00570 [Clostridia bacterium]|nr:hypothetical protein [Clostridia bacterium]
MKKILSLITTLIIILCSMTFFSCKDNDTVSKEPRGYITAINKELFTAANNGERIILTGVNAGGWLLTEDWMCPTSLNGNLHEERGQYEYEDAFTELYGLEKSQELFNQYRENWWGEEDFDNCLAIGINMIRLPFGWRDLQELDYTYRDNPFERLDYFVENCAERGIYVILDLHGAHGSQNGKHHSGDTRTGGDLYGNEINMALTEELWVRVAEHYKDNKWVAGYDLLNEPEGTPGALMTKNTPHWAYYDRLYNSIRLIDSNHMIIMEGVWEINSLPDPVLFGWTNVCYELHFYQWNNSNSLVAQQNFLMTKILLNEICNYNVPLFIGEFTFFDNQASWEYALSLFNEKGWSWALWTYKVMGADSSWGLYCGENRTLNNSVTASDSEEVIAEKWSRLSTSEHFTPNQWLIDVIMEYTFKGN